MPPDQNKQDDNQDNLKSRIDDAIDRHDAQYNPQPQNIYSTPGARAGTEFIAHIIAGAILGVVLDKALGTAPLLLVLFLLAGFGTGIWRSSAILSKK